MLWSWLAPAVDAVGKYGMKYMYKPILVPKLVPWPSSTVPLASFEELMFVYEQSIVCHWIQLIHQFLLSFDPFLFNCLRMPSNHQTLQESSSVQPVLHSRQPLSTTSSQPVRVGIRTRIRQWNPRPLLVTVVCSYWGYHDH